MKSLNRTIWIYWHQGWENAPIITQRCLETWISQNPGWEIKILDKTNLTKYIRLEEVLDNFLSKEITLASLSDIIRICLLHKYGGIWVDSTLFCRVPLNDWIGDLTKHDFFAFEKPGVDRMISSWFLIAKNNSYIINAWFQKTISYWKGRNRNDEYFWFHYRFNELYESDIKFKELWDNTPKIAAKAPHYFIPYTKKFFHLISEKLINEIGRIDSPVFKLTIKYDVQKENADTVLEHILKNDLPIKSKKILVTWYGSFKKSGTVGDYLSVKVLTKFLAEKHYDFDCACYKNLQALTGNQVDLSSLDPNDYRILVFCCGPIIKGHSEMEKLIKRFQNHPKAAVSISLFPRDHINFFNPFDAVLARENGNKKYTDLAILDEGPKQLKRKATVFKIGLVLRNRQSEYGIENCHSDEANAVLREAANALVRKNSSLLLKIKGLFHNEPQVIEINNHLENSEMTPEKIESMYQQCRFIFTTRFHGAMIALKNNIPFIAIDQIINGAKVYKLLSDIGYPFIYKVNELNNVNIIQEAEYLLKGNYTQEAKYLLDKTRNNAQKTLSELEDILNGMINKN